MVMRLGKKVFADNPNIMYVMHTASPLLLQEPKDPNDILKPAIEGTACVIKAAIKNRVRRIVLTSSMAAVCDPVTDGRTYTPQDWSNPEEQNTYAKSKTLAEKTARELVDGTKTELCTVNPFFVLGPTLYSDESLISDFKSGNIVAQCVTGNMPAVPNVFMGLTDVRDVAEAHMKAMTMGPAGGRYILSNSPPSSMKYFQERIAALAGQKSAFVLPSCFLGILALCSADAKSIKYMLDIEYDVDASETNKILGYEFIPEESTLKDMVEDFIKLGVGRKK